MIKKQMIGTIRKDQNNELFTLQYKWFVLNLHIGEKYD